MEDRLSRLESRVAYLSDRVASLEQRLERDEERSPGIIAASRDRSAFDPSIDTEKIRVQYLLGLAGRTLVVLGGAYLLRAFTESRLLTAFAGVGLGILYGAPWLLLASRAAARGAQLDAFVHALTAALIGYPLVWEATLRFGVASAPQSAALLGILTSGAFVLSWARSLQGLAWVAMIGTLISAIGLAIGTGVWIPYTVVGIAVGIGTLWLGYTRDWTALRWPAAAIANAMLLIVTARSAVHGHLRAALAVQMLMLAGYLGSFAIRTLFIGRPVIPFEVAQSICVLLVAFGGAISLIRGSGSNVLVVGVASLVLAVAGYVVAFSFVDRHRHRKNFFFYAQLAQLFAIVGIGLCVGSAAGSAVYSLAAVVTAALARHKGRLTLALQAAVYAIAGALASGLVEHATMALLSAAMDSYFFSLTSMLALTALVVVTFLPVRNPIKSAAVLASVLRVVLLALLVWTAAGVSIAILVLLGGEHMGGPLLSTIRTAVLVFATLALAFAAHYARAREAAWLVYPLLLVAGMKLVVIDFPQGHPQTLFAALALYGIALSAAPRLLRRAVLPPRTPSSGRTPGAARTASADALAVARERRL
ncbi:MAG TPA: hypothetical protein VFT39_05400 [Vicinamibacterales bacterium]|nr:hypothetical protein [Vicinamibacterales bacterium]